jgi:biuret amidohydrolase
MSSTEPSFPPPPASKSGTSAAAAAARLREIADPAHTVVVTVELQKGVVGDDALLPALPRAVREAGILPVAGRVCREARRHGVRVVHATVCERSDGAGKAVNCKIFALTAKLQRARGFGPIDIGRPGVQLVDELDVQPSDIEVTRSHGITAFTSTSLDQIIRNLGGRTVILVGVSLNLGVMGAALTAVDLGYQVVVVRDAVVGVPREYGEAMLENAYPMIATVVTADDLVEAWAAAASAGRIS